MLTTVDPRVQMSGLIMGFVPAQAIAIAAELGIADLVAREPMTATQLAEATGSDARALYRVMRYLASLGIFQADERERFGLTPLAELLRSDAPDSMRSMSRIMGRVGPGTVGGLLEGVRTGKNPFAAAFGQHLFEYLPTHPEDAVLFDAAMNGFHGPETDAVLGAYSYDGVSTLADIGCGNGTVLTATLRRYPSLKGVFFDQPDVVERARAAADQDISGRSRFVSGSFFESVPAGADAYQMRHIIHDWERRALAADPEEHPQRDSLEWPRARCRDNRSRGQRSIGREAVRHDDDAVPAQWPGTDRARIQRPARCRRLRGHQRDADCLAGLGHRRATGVTRNGPFGSFERSDRSNRSAFDSSGTFIVHAQ
jgi:hypothetical protein